MKKLIIAAAAASMLITGVCLSASAEYPVSLSYSGGYAVMTATPGNTEKGTLIAASITDGVLTKVKLYKNVSDIVYINNDFNSSETVKLMYWDSVSMEPMADSIEAVIENEMKFGVFSKNVKVLNDHNEKVLALMIFTNGEESYFMCCEGINAEDLDLSEGDVIMYALNSEEEIIEVKKLFCGGVDLTDTESLWTAAKADSAAMVDREYVQGLKEGNENTDLYFGAICDRALQWFEVTDIKDNISDIEYGTTEVDLYDGINIYVLDYNQKAGNRISVGNKWDIQKTGVSSGAWIDDKKSKVDWSKNRNPNLALVRGVDREAVDVVVIEPKLN